MSTGNRKGKEQHMQTSRALDWDAMVKAHKAVPDAMVSIRAPQPLIDAAKDEAAKRGIPYSVLIRQALVKLLREAE
jgi:predicted DNA binding CopG/RHH family protein